MAADLSVNGTANCYSMETLKNSILTVSVSECGAELTSTRKDGTEYPWQADPAFRKRGIEWARNNSSLASTVLRGICTLR